MTNANNKYYSRVQFYIIVKMIRYIYVETSGKHKLINVQSILHHKLWLIQEDNELHRHKKYASSVASREEIKNFLT